jgi:hypothetical protein
MTANTCVSCKCSSVSWANLILKKVYDGNATALIKIGEGTYGKCFKVKIKDIDDFVGYKNNKNET